MTSYFFEDAEEKTKEPTTSKVVGSFVVVENESCAFGYPLIVLNYSENS